MKKPKLVRKGDDLLLVFTPGAQKQFNIDDNTTYTEELIDGKIVITLSRQIDPNNDDEEFRALAKEIVKQYEPVFKKLAKN
jgi:hypothetical protein